ncbi:MAG: hypothetical protein ABI275_05425 [Terrimesophilobacter sp.]
MGDSRNETSAATSAVARFSAAEARLYPLAMADTEAFERATSLVGLVATELRSCGGVAEVVEQLGGVVARLQQTADAAHIDTTGLPLSVVADAAAAIRCRQLKAEQAAADVRERIERARAAGQAWLVEEASPAMMMAGIQQRQELHLPTGATLVTTVDGETADDEPVYSLELIPGSPANGVVAVSENYADRSEWLAAAQRLRAALSA